MASTQDLLFKILISASAGQAIKEFADLNRKIESIKTTLDTVLGSEEATAAALQHISKIADNSGQSFVDLAHEYAQFSAAAKGTALEGDATREIFDAVSIVMGRLGKTTGETHRVFIALTQMMSKGQVYAEEWRGQLGEALPLANEAVRKATSLTTAEFNKLMQAGQLMSVDVLPVLAKGLRELVPDGVDNKVDNLSASLNRLDNAIAKAFIDPGQAGLSDALSNIVDGAAYSVKWFSAAVVNAGKDFGAFGATVAKSAGDIADEFSNLGSDLSNLGKASGGTFDEFKAAATDVVGGLGKLGSEILDTSREFSDFHDVVLENRAAAWELISGYKDAKDEIASFSDTLAEAAAKSLLASSKYVELLDAAKAHTEILVKNNAATAQSAKETKLFAEITGDLSTKLKAEAEASDAAAKSARDVADAQQATLDVMEKRKESILASIAQLEKLKTADNADKASVDLQITARTAQLPILEKTRAAQQATTEKANALAVAEETAALKARIANETYGDQSGKLGTLIGQLGHARLALSNITQAHNDAAVAAKALGPAEQELADLMARYEAASRDSSSGNLELSGSLQDLGEQVLAAQVKVEDLKTKVAAGAEADKKAKDAKEAVALSLVKVKDAYQDLIAKRAEELTQAERATSLDKASSDTRVQAIKDLATETERRAEIAKVLGNEKDALKLSTDARELNITAVEAESAVAQQYLADKQAELVSAQSELAAKQKLYDLTTQHTQAEIAALYAARNLVAEKANDVTAAQESAAAKESEATSTKNLADAEDKLSAKAKSATDTASGAAVAMSKIIDSVVSDLSKVSESGANAVDAIIQSVDSWYGKVQNIRELSASDFVDATSLDTLKSDLAELETEAASASTAARALGNAWQGAFNYFGDFYTGIGEIEKFKASLLDAEAAAKRTEIAVAEMGSSLDSLTASYDDGSLGLADYISKLQLLRGQYASLSDEDVSALTDALDSAKSAQQDLTDTAKDGLDSWKEKLYGIYDQEVEIQKLNWQSDLLDAQTALIEAKKNGNAEEIAALNEKIALINEYYQIKVDEAALADAQQAIDDAAAAAAEADRLAGLSAEERQYEDTIAALKQQLADAIEANDAALKQSILDQITAEKARHELVMANTDTETNAKTSSTSKTSGTTSGSTTTSGVTATGNTQPVRTVNVNISTPSGKTGTVQVLEGQESTLEALLKSLESGKAVAQ